MTMTPVSRSYQAGKTPRCQKLMSMNFTSGIPGCEGAKLWCTKSKTEEERAKVRAIVLSKAFDKGLTQKGCQGTIPKNSLEISWNGKVHLKRFQVNLLKSVERDGEPKPYDVCIEDSKGNHVNWFLKAGVFSQNTGKGEEELQDLWLSSSPTLAQVRADS